MSQDLPPSVESSLARIADALEAIAETLARDPRICDELHRIGEQLGTMLDEGLPVRDRSR